VSDLLVRGGTIVTDGAAARADVLVRDGIIHAVGAVESEDADTLDARGCLVIPGAVDIHTHVLGALASDGWAALAGGTTTAATFIDEAPGLSPAAIAERAIADLPGAPLDLAVHGVVWEPGAYERGDLARLCELGVTTVKLWLAYEELGIMADDGQLLAMMSEAAAEGVTVMAHCENGRMATVLAAALRASGHTELREHGRARPIALEAEAVHRFLAIGRLAGAETYVVHVSGRAPLEEIRAARRAGQHVLAEVCTHHLVFDDGRYEGDDALRFMMTPPLRDPEDPPALWDALARGELDVLSSDHSHVRLHPDKTAVAADVTAVPFGVPGVQWRLAVAHTAGVLTGRLSFERLVEAACAAPAKALGLFPRKGTIRAGSDGDLVVWDPGMVVEVGAATRRDGLDYSPYDGMVLTGGPRVVIAGGEIVIREGEVLERSSPGRYLGRTPLPTSRQVIGAR
jgi:dihydropyrimidinase